MHPILIRLGPWTIPFLGIKDWSPAIHTFGPLVALGAFLGILYMRREGKRRGLDPEVLTGYAVEVLLAGVVGSRILFCLITPEAFPILAERSWFENHVLQYIALWNGGLVWYGGIIFAWPVVVGRAKHLGLPVRTVCDLVAPTIMFGLAVGRIGCLMAGDDHGRIVESGAHWWTITFTDKEALVAPSCLGRPLFPTQPHMGWGAILCGYISHRAALRWTSRPGSGALALGIVYPLHRFIVELFRGDTVRKFLSIPGITTYDENGTAIGGLSTSQAISIPIMLLGAGFLIWKLKTPGQGREPIPLEAAEPLVKEAAATPVGSPLREMLARLPGGFPIVIFAYIGLEIGVVVARRLEVAGMFSPALGYFLFPAAFAVLFLAVERAYSHKHPAGLLDAPEALLVKAPELLAKAPETPVVAAPASASVPAPEKTAPAPPIEPGPSA